MQNHQKHWRITSRIQSQDALKQSSEHEIIIGMKPCGEQEYECAINDQVRLQLLKLDLKKNPLLHPPFGGDMRSMIGYLVGAFPFIMQWSYEMWEDYLRKEADPEAEIDHWMAVDKAFTNFAGGKSLECQMEVFRLLMLHCTPLAILNEECNKNTLLSDELVDAILNDYYAHYTDG